MGKKGTEKKVMKKIVYKETIIGGSWDHKISAFVNTIRLRHDGDTEEIIHELANNIMVRDMILDIVFKVTEEKKFELFEQFNKYIEDIEKEKSQEKK